MAVLLRHAVFIHVPKTGGTWVAEALRRAHLIERPLGPVHATPAEARDHRDHVPGRTPFAIVRHPATWYASVWAHRMDERWCAIDAREWFSPESIERWAAFTDRCRSTTFAEFVRLCVDAFPEGWLSGLYDTYVGPGTTVGRFENLVEDTITILKEVGEVFDEAIVRGTERQNVRGALPGHRVRTTFTPAILDLIRAGEQRAYARFGYDPDAPPLQPPVRTSRPGFVARALARLSSARRTDPSS